MKFKNLFSKNIMVIPIKETEIGLIFYVKNGKSLLREAYFSSNYASLYSLVFNGVPLTRFHGDYGFSPTCQKMISAGYGLDKCENKIFDELSSKINQPFISLNDSLEILTPLLGLLTTGYYMLSDNLLFPTNGENEFFWNITNKPKYNLASSQIYDEVSFNFTSPEPKYILPTQSPDKFNRNRAEYYRDKPNTRGIAYFLQGNLCALLDGHHKAVAAALESRPLKTLVIRSSNISLDMNSKRELMVGNVSIPEKNLPFKLKFQKQKSSSLENQRNMINPSFDNYIWEEDILNTSHSYYDAYANACLQWTKDISEEQIKAVLAGQEILDESTLSHIIIAMFAAKHSSFLSLALFICRNENYIKLWGNVFNLLSKVKSKEVESFFIDYLINEEGTRPHLKLIADTYLANS